MQHHRAENGHADRPAHRAEKVCTAVAMPISPAGTEFCDATIMGGRLAPMPTPSRKERPTTAARASVPAATASTRNAAVATARPTSGDSLYLPVKRMYCPDRYAPNTTPNNGAVSSTPAWPTVLARHSCK